MSTIQPNAVLGEFPAHLFPRPAPSPLPAGIRYYITDDLWNSFSEEQVAEQKARMIETGRWFPPSKPFILRLPFATLFEQAGVGFNQEACIGQTQLAAVAQGVNPDSIETFRDLRSENYVDLHFVGGKATKVYQVIRRQFPGWSTAEKHAFIAGTFKAPPSALYANLAQWWERGSWCCERWDMLACTGLDVLKAFAEQQATDMLTIILQDRSIDRVEIEPREDSAKFKRLRLAEQRSDNHPHETVLYCPRRVYTGEQGGTHASPKMHYRAEHVRQQPHGPNRTLRKEIVIAAQWINAADIDPAELGTPVRLYKLVPGEPR